MTKFSYFLGSEQWQPEELINHAKLAKEVGFDMVTISEHFHPWVDDYSASNFTWSTLGALAVTIPDLDLGTGCYNTTVENASRSCCSSICNY